MMLWLVVTVFCSWALGADQEDKAQCKNKCEKKLQFDDPDPNCGDKNACEKQDCLDTIKGAGFEDCEALKLHFWGKCSYDLGTGIPEGGWENVRRDSQIPSPFCAKKDDPENCTGNAQYMPAGTTIYSICKLACDPLCGAPTYSPTPYLECECNDDNSLIPESYEDFFGTRYGTVCGAWDDGYDYCDPKDNSYRSGNGLKEDPPNDDPADNWCPQEWCYVTKGCTVGDRDWDTNPREPQMYQTVVFHDDDTGKPVDMWYSYLHCGAYVPGGVQWPQFEDCKTRTEPLDVYFVVDGSSSVEDWWGDQSYFVSQLIRRSIINEEDRVGFVQFAGEGKDPETAFTFEKPTMSWDDKWEMVKEPMEQIMGGTATDKGIAAALDNWEDESYDAPWNEENRSRLLVVVTDGVPNPTYASPCGENDDRYDILPRLEDMNIQLVIIAVNMKLAERYQLACLVEDPELNIVALDDFESFWQYRDPTSHDNDGLLCVDPNDLTPSKAPTPAPSPLPTTRDPSPSPSPKPTSEPSPKPSPNPTRSPTDSDSPTLQPTGSPTQTDNPSMSPTLPPTDSDHPTPHPTKEPTKRTRKPSPMPTRDPSELPSLSPSPSPTEKPSHKPSPMPSHDPTHEPSPVPTSDPTSEPTHAPTNPPTSEPTAEPTLEPTAEPTTKPTTGICPAYVNPRPKILPCNDDGSNPCEVDKEHNNKICMKKKTQRSCERKKECMWKDAHKGEKGMCMSNGGGDCDGGGDCNAPCGPCVQKPSPPVVKKNIPWGGTQSPDYWYNCVSRWCSKYTWMGGPEQCHYEPKYGCGCEAMSEEDCRGDPECCWAGEAAGCQEKVECARLTFEQCLKHSDKCAPCGNGSCGYKCEMGPGQNIPGFQSLVLDCNCECKVTQMF